MGHRNKFLAAFICLIILGLFCFAGCNLLPGPSSISDPNEQVEDDTPSNVVSTTADVIPEKEATLRFKNNATNIQLQVNKGTFVDAGDILVKSDAYQQTLAVDEAEAQLANAQALYDSLIREEVREVRQPEKDAAFEQIEAAEAALDLAQVNLSATSIFAPFDGAVIDIYVDPYTNVLVGEPVLLIADVENLILETDDLDEKEAARVEPGDAVNIFFDAIPGQSYAGIVTKIAQKTTSGAGNDLAVTISSLEPIQKLRWGMSAFVEIAIGSAAEGATIISNIPASESEREANLEVEPKEKRICETTDFISETIQDGSIFAPGEALTKSWTLRNIGTCTWDTNYKLVFVEGDLMGAQASIPFPGYVAPNDLMTIEIELTAPEEAGAYRGTWQLQNDIGGKLNTLWVDIIVSEE